VKRRKGVRFIYMLGRSLWVGFIAKETHPYF